MWFHRRIQTVVEHEQTCPLKGKGTAIRKESQEDISTDERFLKFSPDLCTICYDDANDVDQIYFAIDAMWQCINPVTM